MCSERAKKISGISYNDVIALLGKFVNTSIYVTNEIYFLFVILLGGGKGERGSVCVVVYGDWVELVSGRVYLQIIGSISAVFGSMTNSISIYLTLYTHMRISVYTCVCMCNIEEFQGFIS